jgi:hypothetical protein
MNKEKQPTTAKLMSMKIQNAGRPQRVKIIRRSVLGSLLASIGFLMPALALAQYSVGGTSGSLAVTSVPSLFSVALGILNFWVVPIIFAIAFVMFLFGVYVNFIAPGASEEASKKGGQFVIWSIIGFVLMFSIWGLINIFINTFALQNNQPNLPTFGAPASSALTNSSNSLGSLFSGLLGGGGTVSGTASTGYTVGQTITDPVTGQTFVATGSNTYAAQNGSCGSGISLGNGQCRPSTSSTQKSAAGSTGQACVNNDQCPDICDTVTGTCQANGPNTYSCDDDSTPQMGKCSDGTSPMNSAGNYAPSGSNGSACTQNSQCPDVCNTVTGTCATSGPNTYACNDGATYNLGTGMCSDGQSPQNSGDGVAPQTASLPVGGNCSANPNACSGSATCQNGICVAGDTSGNSSQNSSNSPLGQGEGCSPTTPGGPDLTCASGLVCDDNGYCNPPSGSDSSSNTTTAVSCNDGQSDFYGTNCANDCGVYNTPNTCDNSNNNADGYDSSF